MGTRASRLGINLEPRTDMSGSVGDAINLKFQVALRPSSGLSPYVCTWFSLCVYLAFKSLLPICTVSVFFFFIHFSLCIRFSMRSHCVNFASVNLVLFLVSFTVTLTELKSELILMMIGRKITVLKTDHISVGIYRKVKMVISKPFLHGLD